MQRSWASLTLLIAFTGCAPRREEPANENSVAANLSVAPNVVTSMAPDTSNPGDPGGLPDDRTLVAEGTIDPKSAQRAAQVLQQFGVLLEQGKFAAARQSWSDGGKASGLTEAEFADAYAKYADIHAEVGAPGEPEGAAGSSYVEIPLRLHGKLKTGRPFNLVGPVILRRVNDVPGSSAAQREWHIYRSDLKPQP